MDNFQKDKKVFEDIKHINDLGMEYWFARELAVVLQYKRFDKFLNVLAKAVVACKNTGIDADYHFSRVGKMITIGKGGQRNTDDYMLSRYACYLILQNADPNKPVVASGQTYFAIQTRRQEIADKIVELTENEKRILLRENVRAGNVKLADAAHSAGIETDLEYAVFQNFGYMGLYGGLTVEQIHNKKGLSSGQKILDYMGSEELANNLFRIVQTEARIKREKPETKEEANAIHNQVGKVVRKAIKELGGEMPENLPTPKESISEIEKEEMKKLGKSGKLMLDE
jgi:DNA-damage-inducible protein D